MIKQGGGFHEGLPSMLEQCYESTEENVGPQRSVVMSWGKVVGGAWNCSVSSGLFIDRLWQHNLSVMVLSPEFVISCVMVLGSGLFIPILFCSYFLMCHVLHYVSCFILLQPFLLFFHRLIISIFLLSLSFFNVKVLFLYDFSFFSCPYAYCLKCSLKFCSLCGCCWFL